MSKHSKPRPNGFFLGWNFSRHHRGGKHGHWRRLQEPKEQVRESDYFKTLLIMLSHNFNYDRFPGITLTPTSWTSQRRTWKSQTTWKMEWLLTGTHLNRWICHCLLYLEVFRSEIQVFDFFLWSTPSRLLLSRYWTTLIRRSFSPSQSSTLFYSRRLHGTRRTGGNRLVGKW